MNNREEKAGNSLYRKITRREALKAGGLTALGLIFTTPKIDTIRPLPLTQTISPVGPQPTPTPNPMCTAFIDAQSSGITGPGAGGESVASGAANTYAVQLAFDCGQCSGGNCNPDIQYQWSEVSTNALDVQIASPNSPSTTVTPAIGLGGAGFGVARFTLQVTVTLTCGTGSCLSTAQAVLSTTMNVFA